MGLLGLKDVKELTEWTPNTLINDHIRNSGEDIAISKLFTNVSASIIFWMTDKGDIYANGKWKNKGSTKDGYIPQLVSLSLQEKHPIDIVVTPNYKYKNYDMFALCISPNTDNEGLNDILSYWSENKQIPGDVIAIINSYYDIRILRGSEIYECVDEIDSPWELIEFEKDVIVTNIACGLEFMLFLSNEGTVYSKGTNKYGQCGVDRKGNKGRPIHLVSWSFSDNIIVQICCGDEHCLALTNDGNVYSWGRNTWGQCGREADDEFKSVALFKPEFIDDLMEFEIIEIAAAKDNSYAKSNDNKHWLWGDNKWGQCTLKTRNKTKDNDEIREPYRIDDIFYKKTKREIDQVYLGYQAVYIIA